MELAEVLSRLADSAERLLAHVERRERDERDERLLARWSTRAPRRGGISLYLEAIPGLAGLFDRVVPAEFVAQTGEREMTIACPCGHEPVIGPGELVACECSRWFLYDGHTVHVALSPTAPDTA